MSFLPDLRIAFRSLTRARAMWFTVGVTLALGIGANAAKAKRWGRLKAFIGSEFFVWSLAARTFRAQRQALGVRYLAVL